MYKKLLMSKKLFTERSLLILLTVILLVCASLLLTKYKRPSHLIDPFNTENSTSQ